MLFRSLYSFIILAIVIAIPKDYSRFGRISTFRFVTDASVRNCRQHSKCGVDVLLNWKKQLESSCLSTPIIYPIHQNGKDDILVNTFWKYADIVSPNGISYEDWPKSYGDNRFYGSPIPFDINSDGMEEIISVDDDGVIRIVQLNDYHSYNSTKTISLPSIHIDRFWFEKSSEITKMSEIEQLSSVSRSIILHIDVDDMTVQLKNKKQQQAARYEKNDQKHISVDPHVLTSISRYIHPSSSSLYLTIPISYYLSSNDYRNGIPGIVLEKYLACGVICVNLSTNTVEWSRIFGISTTTSSSKAYIYSTPTTVDLEGMGQLTTLFGTSQGLLYAINEQGKTKRGFPVQFAEIQMSPVCADIAKDAYLEIIVGDKSGVLAVLDHQGEEVWSRSLSGSLSQSVSIADINGDGVLDVIAVTDNGDVWVLDGEKGKEVANFPIRTGSSVKMSPLVIDLSIKQNSIHIVFVGGEGDLIIIDAKSGCIRRIDISEEVYTRVVAMKTPDASTISLLLSTMNGNLYQFTTSAPWTSMNTYHDQGNNLDSIYSPHYLGIYFGSGKEQWFDVMGEHILLPITITDRRKNQYNQQYTIRVLRKGVVLLEERFEKPGDYLLRFEIKETGYYNLVVLLMNEHMQTVQMDVSIHANIEVLRYIKSMILIPYILLTTLLLLSSNLGTPLPL